MNKKYRGLVRREMLLCKKSLRINLLLYFAVLAIAVLIFMSLRYGNMKQWLSDDEVGKMIVPMLKALFIVIGATAPVTAFCSSYDDNIITDFQCGWQKYSYTLPISVDEQIKLKLGMKFAGFVPAAILGFVSLGVVRAASGEAIGRDYWILFAAALCCGLMYAFIQLPVLMQTRNRDKSGMMISGVLLAVAMGATYLFVKRTKSFLGINGLESISDMSPELQEAYTAELMKVLHSVTNFAWVLPIIAVIVIAASMIWTKKMLKERIC